MPHPSWGPLLAPKGDPNGPEEAAKLWRDEGPRGEQTIRPHGRWTRFEVAEARQAPQRDETVSRHLDIAFSVVLCENGFLFQDYDIATDVCRKKVAKNGVELERIFYEWAAEIGKHLSQLEPGHAVKEGQIEVHDISEHIRDDARWLSPEASGRSFTGDGPTEWREDTEKR